MKKNKPAFWQQCPQCGERFFVPVAGEWLYRGRRYQGKELLYFCSWKCLRAAERQKKATAAELPKDALQKGVAF